MYDVINYGGGWRKDAVNKCLEFDRKLVGTSAWEAGVRVHRRASHVHDDRGPTSLILQDGFLSDIHLFSTSLSFLAIDRVITSLA